MKVTKIIEIDGQRAKVVAEYGTSRGRFSLTGEVYFKRPGGVFRREPDLCGQVTDEILSAFPWLTQFAEMHLADATTGEPLYALENGWYWFEAEKHDTPTYPLTYPDGWKELTNGERAAAYLNVPPTWFDGVSTKEQFSERIDALRLIWEQRAKLTRELYQLDNQGDEN